MENFEEHLRRLLADKLTAARHPLEPDLKDSLEALLEHVYEKALAPAYQILIEQEAFADSTINDNDFFGDTVEDGMDDRKMITLAVVRNQQPLFEYRLTFDGDTEDTESKLWRYVEFAVHPLDMATFFTDDSWETGIEAPWQENLPGRTILNKKVVDLVGIGGEHFPLDMDEAVRQVQADFYWVCETLL